MFKQHGHYINLPFKPKGQPDSVRTKPPAKVNILTALTENERIAKSTTDDPRNAQFALTWTFVRTVSLPTR